MTAQQSKQGKTYKSPPHKLIKFFEKSRDAWKTKCRAAKKMVKRLKDRMRFLEQSKAQWKSRAQEFEKEVERLQSRNTVLESEVETLKKSK